jgi:hypothetical protein
MPEVRIIKKILAVLLIIAVAAGMLPPFIFAEQAPPQGPEVQFYSKIVCGHWDIWKHISGHWQDTGQPGFRIPQDLSRGTWSSYTSIPLDDPLEHLPSKFNEQYDNIRFVVSLDINEEVFNRVNAYWTNVDWEQFEDKYLNRKPKYHKLVGENSVTFTLHSNPEGARIEDLKETKADEGPFHDITEGWRWYLPWVIYYYGVPKDHALPDFEVVALQPGTEEMEPGVSYTGSVFFKLKNTVNEPVEAEITLTHNGYSISSTDGELIDGQRLTFNPGEGKEFTFKWTGQRADSRIVAEIWPTEPENLPKEQRDAKPDDNRSVAPIKAAGVPQQSGKT